MMIHVDQSWLSLLGVLPVLYIVAPRTWVPGELVTSNMMNTLRDLFLEIEAGTADMLKVLLTGRTTAALSGDLSPASHATFAYDSTLDKLVASINGGAYSVVNPDFAYSEVALTDGATVAIDAALGMVGTGAFRLAATGDRTLLSPSNPSPSRRIIIAHLASGGARTLSLTVGSAGAFRFGSDVPSLTQTVSGKTDYIGAAYNETDDRWDVLAYVKGY